MELPVTVQLFKTTKIPMINKQMCRNGVTGSMHWNLKANAQFGYVNFHLFLLENEGSYDVQLFKTTEVPMMNKSV